MQSLSRSTGLMFTFDLAVLFIVTYYFAGNFANNTMSVLTTILVTIVGLFSFYLKGQYKIREHNLTKWNLYRLFEGILFANIPAVLLLFFFVPKLVLFRFLILNISLDSQNENCRTQNANISILRLVRGKYSNFVCHTF